MEIYEHYEDISEDTFLKFVKIGHEYVEKNRYNFWSLNRENESAYSVFDQLLSKNEDANIRKVLDLHGYYQDGEYENNEYIDRVKMFKEIFTEGEYNLLAEELTYEAQGYNVTSVFGNELENLLKDISIKFPDLKIDIVEDTLNYFYIYDDDFHENLIYEEKRDFIFEKIGEEGLEIISSESIDIIYYNGDLYKEVLNIVISISAFLSLMIGNQYINGYIHGQNLINFFEEFYYQLTRKDINISRKFNAEVNNFAKDQIACHYLMSFFDYIDEFEGSVNYYKLKKFALPDEYSFKSRKQIERIKRMELFEILNNYGYLNDYSGYGGDSIIFNNNYPNSILPIDYIAHLRNLQDYNYLWEEDFFEKVMYLIDEKGYTRKSEIFEKENIDKNVTPEIINYLKNIEIYQIDKYLIFETDFIPEFLAMGIAPQASCQSILQNTGYNHKILGHILNPLTKLILVFNLPSEGIEDINIEKRTFTINGEETNMSDYLVARNVLVLNDGNGPKLQGFYGSFRGDTFELEKKVKEKYLELSNKYQYLHEIYENELGDNNYYQEGSEIINNNENCEIN